MFRDYKEIKAGISRDLNCFIVELEQTKSTVLNIHFDYYYLEDEHVESIKKCIETNKLLNKIELWCPNEYGERGMPLAPPSYKMGDYLMESLAEALKLNRSVNTLIIGGNWYSTDGLQYLLDTLNLLLSITYLGFEWSKLLGAGYLSKFVAVNTSLTTLNLYGSKFGDEWFAEVLDILKAKSTLTYINLASCYIDDQQLASIADELKFNTSLTRVDLSDNKFTNLQPLCDVVATNTKLTRVEFSNLHPSLEYPPNPVFWKIWDKHAAFITEKLIHNALYGPLQRGDQGYYFSYLPHELVEHLMKFIMADHSKLKQVHKEMRERPHKRFIPVDRSFLLFDGIAFNNDKRPKPIKEKETITTVPVVTNNDKGLTSQRSFYKPVIPTKTSSCEKVKVASAIKFFEQKINEKAALEPAKRDACRKVI